MCVTRFLNSLFLPALAFTLEGKSKKSFVSPAFPCAHQPSHRQLPSHILRYSFSVWVTDALYFLKRTPFLFFTHQAKRIIPLYVKLGFLVLCLLSCIRWIGCSLLSHFFILSLSQKVSLATHRFPFVLYTCYVISFPYSGMKVHFKLSSKFPDVLHYTLSVFFYFFRYHILFNFLIYSCFFFFFS